MFPGFFYVHLIMISPYTQIDLLKFNKKFNLGYSTR
jgi:hypothetical protein